MKKWIRLPLIFNKRNGQVNIALPKKQISETLRKKLPNSKFAYLWLEDLD